MAMNVEIRCDVDGKTLHEQDRRAHHAREMHSTSHILLIGTPMRSAIGVLRRTVSTCPRDPTVAIPRNMPRAPEPGLATPWSSLRSKPRSSLMNICSEIDNGRSFLFDEDRRRYRIA
jgi:hypothetical protein